MNYYNEFDQKAAIWLRNLIAEGLIPPGDVDERSIEDVRPCEIGGYAQCHFFAGIGGWPLALQLAGWQPNRPVWTGSCPCQPFSEAGKGAGFDDERHLWPSFQWLIAQCRPTAVFGEQVAGKTVDPWVDLVQTDLEALGYAFGCVAFPAASVGAPHIRDRLYWVADSSSSGLGGRDTRTMGNERTTAERGCGSVGMADATSERLNGIDPLLQWEGVRRVAGDSLEAIGGGAVNGFWRGADWLYCRDDRWRPVEPGTFPLADGIPNRVVRLRGYGNAIVPQAAAEFVKAAMECMPWAQ